MNEKESRDGSYFKKQDIRLKICKRWSLCVRERETKTDNNRE